MLDLILTIAFFIFIFGSFAYLVYWWAKRIAQKDRPDFGLKSSDKFGCH